MAVNITVIRYAGDKLGDPIVEPLLATEAAALARGFGELNKQSVVHREVVVETPYTAGLRLGDILQVYESLSGQPILGRLTGIEVVGSLQDVDGGGNPYAGMRLTLESPTDFADV